MKFFPSKQKYIYWENNHVKYNPRYINSFYCNWWTNIACEGNLRKLGGVKAAKKKVAEMGSDLYITEDHVKRLLTRKDFKKSLPLSFFPCPLIDLTFCCAFLKLLPAQFLPLKINMARWLKTKGFVLSPS